MTTAKKEMPPARTSSGSRELLAAKKSVGRVAAFQSKDEAVVAARKLGDELVRVQVKRVNGSTRKIAEFEITAVEAADLIERTKPPSASTAVILQPTPKLTAAMNGPYVGPFRTKKDLFDALEADDEG